MTETNRVSHKEWLIKYKGCRAKVYAHGPFRSQYTESTTSSGHFMCGEMFPAGMRCMYKICPKIKQPEAV